MRPIIFLFTIIYLLSCSVKSKKETIPPPIGPVKLIAVFTDTNGVKTPAIVVRVIDKMVRYDSIKKVDYVVYDTVYGVERFIWLRDSLNKPIIDSVTGKQKARSIWVPIGKDSVNTKIENVPLDSLLKK